MSNEIRLMQSAPQLRPDDRESATASGQRIQRQAQDARKQFAHASEAIQETWRQFVQTRDGLFADKHLRRAALNLLEDTELARRREDEEAAQRERAEAESRESERRYRTLFERIDEGFCEIEVLFDQNGKPVDYVFLEVNPAFERQTGMANAVGQRMRELAPQHEEFWFETYGRVALTGEPVRFEHEAAHLSQYRYYDVHASRVGEPSQHRVGILFNDITGRKAMEVALRSSEEQFRRAIEDAPIPVIMHAEDGQVLQVSKTWTELTGYGPEDIPTFDAWLTRAYGAGADLVREHVHQLFRGDVRRLDVEIDVYTARGDLRRWSFSASAPGTLRDGRRYVVGMALDITERKHTEDALRESEERQRLLLENATEYAIFSMDLERRVTFWNEGAERLLGYSESEIVGTLADVIFTPQDRADEAPKVEATTALMTGRAADERWHLRKDGTVFWGSGVMTPLRDADGKAIGFVKIFRDQTEQRQAQQALEKSQAELWEALREAEQARKAAEVAHRAKNHFLAVLSHELRTPLTPVIMAVRTLSRLKNLPPAVAEAFEMIERNVQIEAGFIDDLLDVTRIERGKLELDLQPVDLHRVLRHAVEVATPDILTKKQRLTIDLGATQFQVRGDMVRLQQAFWNLLKNASKFTSEEGMISVQSANQENSIVVSIVDSGLGFDPEVADRLFDAFQQANTDVTRKYGGLGLGLAIARATIKGHGGTLNGTSPGPGKGATFTVVLPLLPPTG